MRPITYTLLFLLWLPVVCYAQATRVPKNLKQAVAILKVDCPSSLQETIKRTADKDLAEFTYPSFSNYNYKTIYEWTKRTDKPARLGKYLNSKGITVRQEQVILIAFKRSLLGQQVDERALYQPFQALARRLAAEDNVRFTTDSLRGVYIPKDLEDCFRCIDALWSDSTKQQVKSWTEDEFSGKVHHSFGMWMRNSWQLWVGSRLSSYFNALGIYHPDDMSGIILDSYHRHLTQRALDLPAQVHYYQAYWEKSRQQEAEQQQQQFAAYQVGDTITYYYHMGYVTKAQEEKHDDDSCVAKGIVVEKNAEKRWLNVRLLESCDRKGIISYDNKNTRTLNPKTHKLEAPAHRIIKRMKSGQTRWFAYDDWEPKE